MRTNQGLPGRQKLLVILSEPGLRLAFDMPIRPQCHPLNRGPGPKQENLSSLALQSQMRRTRKKSVLVIQILDPQENPETSNRTMQSLKGHDDHTAQPHLL